eukprot:gnl/Chilomastix_cuspidata/53.p1 GENE.gnl/Chilomastix_cuspidata/53~~gnl/Chilomastix_cuspidata/53.p1  ORF type:complete len:617 (+),score=261.17 gnl/Chilomastix_cuspidata/53:751-2601(+)
MSETSSSSFVQAVHQDDAVVMELPNRPVSSYQSRSTVQYSKKKVIKDKSLGRVSKDTKISGEEGITSAAVGGHDGDYDIDPNDPIMKLPSHLRTGRPKWFRRYHVAIGAVLLHICIGSVYGYSKMTYALQEIYGGESWSWAFSLAIFFLGASASFAGQIIVKLGPRVSAFTSCVFYPLGNILVGLTSLIWPKASDYNVVYGLTLFFYGCIGGIGLGTGYVAPVSTLVKWFPDKRGLATGLAVMGFGLGSLVYTYYFLGLYDVAGLALWKCNVIIGATYCVIMVPATYFFLYMPHPAYAPKNYIAKTNPVTVSKLQRKVKTCIARRRNRELPNFNRIPIIKDVDTKGALKTCQFWMMWLILFLNIHAGISFLGIFYTMIHNLYGLDAKKNTTTLALTSVANCGGRFLWAFVSDYIGRRPMFMVFALCLTIIMAIMPLLIRSESYWPAIVFFLLIYTFYGGGFATIPAFIADMFGVKNTGAVHGAILTAWSIAGLVGPTWVSALSNSLLDKYEDEFGTIEAAQKAYTVPLLIIAGTTFVELILAIAVRPLPVVGWIDLDKDGHAIMKEPSSSHSETSSKALSEEGSSSTTPRPDESVSVGEGSEETTSSSSSPQTSDE